MNANAEITRYAERRDRLVESFRKGGAGVRLSKKTSNLFRDRNAKPKRLLDVRAFDHVLAIDAARGCIDAEGMTTYETLVARGLEHGLMPAIVPELKTITVGGAAAGVGIEASSFRYGLVHETLHEVEVLTGDGRVVVCSSENEHSDLFYGFANSYGTLGYALRVRAPAITVKPYVELEHRRYTNHAAFFEALEHACESDFDFVDAVAFGPGEIVLNVCRFVDAAPYVSDYTFEHIYYLSIREKARDYLTVRDFLWRWDTDWFWCSKNVGAQISWIRRLYGRERLGSRTYQHMMRWNSRFGFTRALDKLRGGHAESVIQDVDVPIARAAEFLAFFQRAIGLTPLWMCPVRASATAHRFPLFPMRRGELYVNFGFWGVLRRRELTHPANSTGSSSARSSSSVGSSHSIQTATSMNRNSARSTVARPIVR